MSAVKERLLSFIDKIGIEKAVFERSASLSNGFVDKVGDKVRSKSLSNISNAFPELNVDWLRTGYGEMLLDIDEKAKSAIYKNTENKPYNGTPVYNIDATCGQDERDMDFTNEEVIGHINLPEISKSAAVIKANGDSMEPVIRDGSWVVIRQVFNWDDIFYGQIYLILLDEYRMIKYIRRYEPDEENYIVLRSENLQYDDIKLHKSKIRKLFVVENILSVKNQF